MLLDQQKKDWLRNGIRKAMYTHFGLSLLSLLLVGFIPIYWTTNSYWVFGASYIISIVWRSIKQPNPLRGSVNPNSMLLNEDEILTYLHPYWESFPRYLYWLPIVPIYIYLVIINSIIDKTFTGSVGLLFIAFLGFGISIFFCNAIYSTYLLRLLNTSDIAEIK
jgi:hypothetical protein